MMAIQIVAFVNNLIDKSSLRLCKVEAQNAALEGRAVDVNTCLEVSFDVLDLVCSHRSSVCA
jgi:hypothetical protein